MNWTQAPFPVAPWDASGLPPRTLDERCQRHRSCAYRDDDPNRCPLCHASRAKCGGGHGMSRFREGVATASHATLKAGQCNDPRAEANRRWGRTWPPPAPAMQAPDTNPHTLQETTV